MPSGLWDPIGWQYKQNPDGWEFQSMYGSTTRDIEIQLLHNNEFKSSITIPIKMLKQLKKHIDSISEEV